ncbi:uncharacterized protein MELLADRAFT_124007, partial [Melampsora larici-populina 98AG31]
MICFSSSRFNLSFIMITCLCQNSTSNNDNKVPYYLPSDGGGQSLNKIPSNGLGEPLNVIISAKSSPEVLTDSGFAKFAKSIGFSQECLGLHLGDIQSANLGDGNGWLNQKKVYRQDYGDPLLGSCLESLIGGNHFRYWRQDGAKASSGALFLTVSSEEDSEKSHKIISNGYNLGRDRLVRNATEINTTFGNRNYSTKVQYVSGMLAPGSVGVNHGISQDGRVAVLTVT